MYVWQDRPLGANVSPIWASIVPRAYRILYVVSGIHDLGRSVDDILAIDSIISVFFDLFYRVRDLCAYSASTGYPGDSSLCEPADQLLEGESEDPADRDPDRRGMLYGHMRFAGIILETREHRAGSDKFLSWNTNRRYSICPRSSARSLRALWGAAPFQSYDPDPFT